MELTKKKPVEVKTTPSLIEIRNREKGLPVETKKTVIANSYTLLYMGLLIGLLVGFIIGKFN